MGYPLVRQLWSLTVSCHMVDFEWPSSSNDYHRKSVVRLGNRQVATSECMTSRVFTGNPFYFLLVTQLESCQRLHAIITSSDLPSK